MKQIVKNKMKLILFEITSITKKGGASTNGWTIEPKTSYSRAVETKTTTTRIVESMINYTKDVEISTTSYTKIVGQ